MTNGRGGGYVIRVVELLVSLVALWLVLRSVDLAASLRLVARANPSYLAPCLAVVAGQIVLRSARWRLLLPPRRGGGLVPWRRVTPVLLVGYLGNAVLPARLGEPIRAYLVARREDVDAAEAFGSVVLERIVDTATLAVVAFAAAVVAGAPEWIVRATAVVAPAGVALTLALVIVGLGPLASLARRVVDAVPGSTVIRPLAARLDDFARGTDRPSRSSAILVAAAISTICWLMDAATFWLVAHSIGVDASPAAALLIAAVTVLGTVLPAAPGYVGTFELAAAGTAQALGIGPDAALALAVLAHLMAVLPLAAAGAVALVAMDTPLRRLARDATGTVAPSRGAQP
jgi:uncharacterized protein (TIRG00374 family)